MREVTERQQIILDFISSYFQIHTYPPTIREIATHFSISVKGAYDHVAALKRKGYLRGDDKRSRALEVVRKEEEDEAVAALPVLGTVAAGHPIAAEEVWDRMIQIPRSMLKSGRNYFALVVQGESMKNAGIRGGDLAIIEQRETADNGEIVVAMVDDAYTLKRFFRGSSWIRLEPENDEFQAIYYQDVRILGRLAHVIRSY